MPALRTRTFPGDLLDDHFDRGASTRCTSKTLNSSSRPNSTDVPSDILVAPLLDVVEDQQHDRATSPH